MKKIILSVVAVSLSAVAVYAQHTPGNVQAAPKNGVLDEWLSRRVAAQSTPLAWVTAVKEQIKKATPASGLFVAFMRDAITARIQPDVTPAVRARLDRWQKAQQENRALPHFFIKALTPQLDVAKLSEKQVAQVEYFLKTGYGTPIARITPQRVQKFKHYLVGIILPPAEAGNPRVQLLFNCYAKEVYVTYDMTQVPEIPVEL